MDDEPFIRDLAELMLSRLGYEVELAADGKEALHLYTRAREENRPFDVVILDMQVDMEMAGIETIYKLRALDPDVQVILASGSLGSPDDLDYRSLGFKAALPKPFTVDQMKTTLDSICNCQAENLGPAH